MFVGYSVVHEIWNKVINWPELLFLLFVNVLEIPEWMDDIPLTPYKKRKLEVIITTTAWVI